MTRDETMRDTIDMAQEAGFVIRKGKILGVDRVGTEDLKDFVKRELFSFASEQDWINKAQSRYANCGVANGYYVTIDAFGRVMHRGQCFKAATEQNAYPVTVYELQTNWIVAEQEKGQP